MFIKLDRFASSALLLGIAALAASSAMAQCYPSKPVHILTSPAGGGGDFQSRIIGQGLTGPLGQPVVVDNRPNNILGEVGSKAAPDGYTLIISGGSLWSLPLLQEVAYDPLRDFAPISLIERSPNLLVVHPTVPVNSVKELVDLARKQPGQLNFSAPASDTRLAAEMFKSMAKIDFTIVNYSNNPTAYQDLVAGRIQFAFGNINTVTPLIKAGKLKVLAVTTLTPSAMFPDLPTIAATVPGFEKAGLGGVFAPARTPDPIIRRINQEVVRIMATSDTKQKFATIAAEAVSSTPEELAATMKAEMSRIQSAMKDAGIVRQ